MVVSMGYSSTNKILENPITGKVVSGTSKEPLGGVSILIKGTNRGTSTNSDGSFKIEAKSTETLIFSFVGYDKKEILVGNQTEINVSLSENVRNDSSEYIIVIFSVKGLKRGGSGQLRKRTKYSSNITRSLG